MADFDTQINVGMNVDGVVSGTEKAKRSVRDLGESARGAGKSFGGIGDGGAQSAQKVESATKSMIQSIQRTTAATEAGDKSTRAYQESLARMRGIDPSVLKPYLDQLDAAKSKAEQAQSAQAALSGGFDSVGVSALRALNPIALIGTAVAAAFSAASIKSVIDTGDAFAKLAQKSGVAVEALRELNYAGSLSDVSTEALGTSLRKLSQNMAAAAGGGKEQAAAFKAVGVEVKGLDGSLKGADTVLKEVAAKFANFKDGPEKAALAIELFGKQGADLIPLLNSGATGLAQMAQEANDLGVVFGDKLAKSAEAFNDNLTRIRSSAEGAKIAIANELLPTLNLLAEAFLKAKKEGSGFGNFIGGALRTVIEGAAILYSEVEFELKGVGRAIGAIGAQIVALGKLDIKGFNAISEAVKEDGVRARKELDKFQYDLLNAGILTSKAGAGRGTAPDPRVIGDTQTTAPIVAKASEAIAKISELTKGINLYNDLVSKSAGFSADYAEKVGLLSAAFAKGGLNVDQLQRAMKQLNSEQDFYKDAIKAAAKAQDDYVKAQLSSIAAAEKAASSAGDALQKYEDEEKALVIAAAKNISLAQAIAEVELARLREAQAKAIGSNANDGVLLALDEEIKKREQLAKAIGRKDGREAAKKSADDIAKEFKRVADQIEQSLTDALLRGFESGKGFAENFRDTLVNLFKTLVLRPIISAVVNPIAGSAASALGLNGGGNGSALDSLGQGKSIYDAISGGFDKLGASVAAGVSSFATSGAGASLGLSKATVFAGPTAGSSAGGYTANSLTQSGAAISKAAGQIATTLAAAYAGAQIGSAISGGRQAINGTSLSDTGATLGALFVGPMGAFLGGVIGGAVDRAFGVGEAKLNEAGIRGNLGATKGTDVGKYSVYQRSNSGLQQLFGNDYSVDRNFDKSPDLTKQLGTAAGVIGATAKAYATAIGVSASAVDSFTKSIDISLKDLSPEQAKVKIAEALAGFGDSLAQELIGSVTTVARAPRGRGDSDYGTTTVRGPSIYAKEGETATQTLQRLATSITAVNSAFKTLDTALIGVSISGAGSASKIIDAFGGLEKFTQSIGAYFDNFYSDAEKRANTVNQLVSGINGAGGSVSVADFAQGGKLDSRSEYRAAVEKAKTDFGADSPLYVALITMSGAFASVTPAASAAAEAVTAVTRSLADIATERSRLQDQLDQLTLTNAELLGKQRGALDESNRALFDQIQAAQLAKTAAQELADAQQAAAQKAADAIEAMTQRVASAMGGLSDIRFGLENQVLTLQGNTAAVATRTRANDLSKLTEGITGRSEIDRITAAYDYNTSLVATIDALTAAKAAAEESARAQVQAQEDASRAAESAANAAEKVRDAWQSVTDSLFEEVKRIRGLMGGGSQQSFAQAQAAFSVTAAQAAAGDQNAAKLLPGLSQALLTLAEAQATSLLQLRVIQGQTAGTLEKIGGQYASQYGLSIPKLATGTNYVPQDMLAILHKGEAVVPVAYNPGNGGTVTNADVVAELQALRATVVALQNAADKTADNTAATNKTLGIVTRGGRAMQTEVFV